MLYVIFTAFSAYKSECSACNKLNALQGKPVKKPKSKKEQVYMCLKSSSEVIWATQHPVQYIVIDNCKEKAWVYRVFTNSFCGSNFMN